MTSPCTRSWRSPMRTRMAVSLNQGWVTVTQLKTGGRAKGFQILRKWKSTSCMVLEVMVKVKNLRIPTKEPQPLRTRFSRTTSKWSILLPVVKIPLPVRCRETPTIAEVLDLSRTAKGLQIPRTRRRLSAQRVRPESHLKTKMTVMKMIVA